MRNGMRLIDRGVTMHLRISCADLQIGTLLLLVRTPGDKCPHCLAGQLLHMSILGSGPLQRL